MQNFKFAAMLGVILFFSACTDAPESDKAETTDAVNVGATAGEAYTVNSNESNIEWVGTKVSGYHEGEIKLKGGQLLVNENSLVGGNFIIDMEEKYIRLTNDKQSNEILISSLSNNELWAKSIDDGEEKPLMILVNGKKK